MAQELATPRPQIVPTLKQLRLKPTSYQATLLVVECQADT